MIAMHKRSITLTSKQVDFLEKEAARIGITVSDLIRRIIDERRDPRPLKLPDFRDAEGFPGWAYLGSERLGSVNQKKKDK